MEGFKLTLEAARVNKGYTQAKAAELLKISIPTLVSYEKGRTSPKHHIAKRMSVVYGAPLDMLDFSLRRSSSKTSKGE